MFKTLPICFFSHVLNYFFQLEENGQEVSLVDDYDRQGGYEDIFTGTCCITDEQDALSDSKDYIHVYKFSASNDGNNFGEPQTVYVYDSTCHNVTLNETYPTITLKVK